MKLSQYAKENSIQYQTAWKMFMKGQIKGYKLPSGTIVITEDINKDSNFLFLLEKYCEENNISHKNFNQVKELLKF